VTGSYSAHSYEFGYWLAASGVNPATDVNVTIVPLGPMADALASGAIGYFLRWRAVEQLGCRQWGRPDSDNQRIDLDVQPGEGPWVDAALGRQGA
jgi:hypothetical protein